MDLQALQKKVEEAQAFLATCQAELDKAKAVFWEEYIKDPSADVVERFDFFVKYAPKKHHSWIQHIKSKRGKELFVYDSGPFYPERREEFDIEQVQERLLEELEEMDDEDYCDGHSYTQEDIHDWMEELMRTRFGSMTYDW